MHAGGMMDLQLCLIRLLASGKGGRGGCLPEPGKAVVSSGQQQLLILRLYLHPPTAVRRQQSLPFHHNYVFNIHRQDTLYFIPNITLY